MSVRLNEERGRFELALPDGELALLEFRRRDDALVLTHTQVPAQHEGEGVASRLAKHALDYARAQQLAVVPECRFVRAWLRRHPDYQDLVRT